MCQQVAFLQIAHEIAFEIARVNGLARKWEQPLCFSRPHYKADNFSRQSFNCVMQMGTDMANVATLGFDFWATTANHAHRVIPCPLTGA
jgi:hypothetical protein